MKFYSHFLFPRLVDRLMRCRILSELRQEVLETARGRLLEVGCGSGLNLSHLPSPVGPVVCTDPNPGMLRLVVKNEACKEGELDLVRCSAEALPFQSGCFDTVVSTWTLCSIPRVSPALEEIRRVLKPSGIFLFAEHGLSPEPKLARWQSRLTPIQRRLADGCHLDRDMVSLITGAGFEMVRLEQDYVDGTPRLFGYTYRGIARTTPAGDRGGSPACNRGGRGN